MRQEATLEVYGTNALKATVRCIVAAEALSPGCRLAVVPRRVADGERQGLALRVRRATELPPPWRSEIRVARETNLGKLAGSVARHLRERRVALAPRHHKA